MDAWTAELRRAGRVVFPLRRRTLLREMLPVPVILVLLAIQSPHALKSGGFLRILGVVVTLACLTVMCVNIWQLVTQRPMLTVDTSGVRLGHRRFMAWSEIGAVAELDGPAFDRFFAVVPSVHGRKLRLSRRYVRNVAALRYWLAALLEEHRGAAEDPEAR